jgi:uncharacterized protein YgiM (DUF1202 family)
MNDSINLVINRCVPKSYAKKIALTVLMIMGMGLLQSAYANCVRNVSSYTNVRSSSSTYQDSVGKLFKSQPAPFINGTTTGQSIGGDNNWYQITFERNTRRYVHSSKIARTTPDGITTADATVNLSSSSSYLNVRSGPGTCYSRRSSLRSGTRVKVTGLTP